MFRWAWLVSMLALTLTACGGDDGDDGPFVDPADGCEGFGVLIKHWDGEWSVTTVSRDGDTENEQTSSSSLWLEIDSISADTCVGTGTVDRHLFSYHQAVPVTITLGGDRFEVLATDEAFAGQGYLRGTWSASRLEGTFYSAKGAPNQEDDQTGEFWFTP